MKFTCLALVALIGTIGTATASDVSPRPDNTTSKAQIQQLVDTFRLAIIAKDGAKLRSLFLPDNGTWLSAYDDETYKALKAKRPDVPKVAPDNYRKFADFVSTSPKPPEEKFSNVRIDTDGTIATVYFDYAFFLDGKQTNDGSETWQLVNTGDGWKISAMLYSVRLDPAKMR